MKASDSSEFLEVSAAHFKPPSSEHTAFVLEEHIDSNDLSDS